MDFKNSSHYDKNNENIKICVIGAGVCGLTTVKIAKEFGFQVSCYEKSPHYGGLWHYTDDPKVEIGPGEDEFYPSVMRTTILNTSKELSAFSDFPPPPKLPNFMKHSLYMDYIRSYVKHFNLEPNLNLSHEILSCKLNYNPIPDNDVKHQIIGNSQLDKLSISNNHLQSGFIKWDIEIKNRKTGEHIRQQFDRLIVATGHHNTPFQAPLPDQQKFKGLIIHSGRVKDILTDERFIDKNVLVIGIANSACDAANDLAIVANKCYVSCHRGNWFLPRLLPGSSIGLYDCTLKNRWFHFLGKHLPTYIKDWKIIQTAKRATNHDLLGLTPKHKPSELVPSINDLFPYRIFTGGVVLKSSLLRLTENGAIFEDEPEVEHPIDCVIVATGYQAKMTFLDEIALGLRSADKSDESDLYMNIFAPKLSLSASNLEFLNARLDEKQSQLIRRQAMKSLAFIGLVQPSGSIAVISELQARYVCSIFSGHTDLPSFDRMLKLNRKANSRRNRSIRSHSRDQIVNDWIEYQDQLAIQLNLKPNLVRLLFTDLPLWRQLMFGPSVSYQYRLTGAGCWPEARKTIIDVPQRIYSGINEGQNKAIFRTKRKCLNEQRKK